MMHIATQMTALIAAGALAAGGLLGTGSSDSAGDALVIDAAGARDGRALIDPRLEELDAEVRLPRTEAEARTNLRYLSAQGYRIVVAGPTSGAAARATGVEAERRAGVSGALAALGR